MGNDMNVPVLTIDSNGEGSLEMSLDVERDDELNPGPTLRRVQAEFERKMLYQVYDPYIS